MNKIMENIFSILKIMKNTLIPEREKDFSEKVTLEKIIYKSLRDIEREKYAETHEIFGIRYHGDDSSYIYTCVNCKGEGFAAKAFVQETVAKIPNKKVFGENAKNSNHIRFKVLEPERYKCLKCDIENSDLHKIAEVRRFKHQYYD